METVSGGVANNVECSMSVDIGAIIGGMIAGPAGFLVGALFMKAYSIGCNQPEQKKSLPFNNRLPYNKF